jgi:hypothetical protein
MALNFCKRFMNTSCLRALAVTLLTMASAQAADGPTQSRVIETSLLAGRAFGGSVDNIEPRQAVSIDSANIFGAVLNFESSESNGFYEFSYFRENTAFAGASPFDVAIEYFHLGGYVTFTDDPKRNTTYFLLTVGATRFIPDKEGLSDPTAFSIATGIGAKFPITQHFLLRLDGRLYATFLDKKDDLFCATPAAGCIIHFEGTTILRGMVSLGATYRF